MTLRIWYNIYKVSYFIESSVLQKYDYEVLSSSECENKEIICIKRNSEEFPRNPCETFCGGAPVVYQNGGPQESNVFLAGIQEENSANFISIHQPDYLNWIQTEAFENI